MKHVKLLPLFILIFPVSQLIGQSYFKHLNRADKAFFEFNYKKAIRHYEQALLEDTTDHVMRSLGQSYLHENNIKISLDYLELTALSPTSLPLDYLEYAQCLKRTGDYEKALTWFEKYREIYPLDIRARNHSLSSYYYRRLARNTKNPLSFSLDMNDSESVLGITKYKNGAILSMTDSRGSGDFMGVPDVYVDLYSAELDSDMQLKKIKFLPFSINSYLNDGPASYSETTQTMAFSSTHFQENSSRTIESHLEIYITTDASGKWSEPQPFIHNNSEYSVTHPAFSQNGEALYFVSDMPDGFGGTDLYVSFFEDGEWTKPTNLGSKINTESNEVFPFVGQGGVLYFASEGHAGLGGLDVFKSYPFEEFWTKPQNLGAPVNSRYDDYGFTKFSDQESYFISDRVGGKGLSDVYYLNLEKARDFFSIPTKLINQYAISEIILEDLSSGEKEVYIPEETKALHLDISENGYKVSWEHLGLTKHIIITGKKDKSGEYEIYLKGLEGLEPKNFISGIEILGKPNPVQIKIDQKVWTYLSPKDQLAFSQNETEVPNYISGADEIIKLDEFGNEVRNETFPPAKPFHKEIFYLEKPKAQEINSFYQQIDRLLEAYEKNETKESVAITLVLSEERIPAEMERFGEKAERYLLENGVEQSKINLSWVNETSILETKSRSSNFEIFITANSQLSFVE